MKRYLAYLLWFVPMIFFAIFYILSNLLAFYIVHLTTRADWVLALPLIVFGPLGIKCAYAICLPYIKKDSSLSQNFKSSYTLISGSILGLALVILFVWGVYAMFQVNVTPQDMGG